MNQESGSSHDGGVGRRGAGPVLCRLQDLAATGCRDFRLGEGDWPLKGFVVQSEAGVRAYVNRCPHRSYPLNDEPDQFLNADRSLLLCRAHGALFDRATGVCVDGPCLGRALTPIEVRVEGGQVLLADGVDVPALRARFA